MLITTTPKPIRMIRDLLAREGKGVVVTRGRTLDNQANLAADFIEAIVARYGGTRIGRQELEGELLIDVPGALWNFELIDECRVEAAPELVRIVTAIDPAVSNNEGSDESGIVVAGRDRNGICYVLADGSGRYAPIEWARRAIQLHQSLKGDKIVAEVNQGGLMVEQTLRGIDPNIPFKGIHASRGKVTRAEPISALYEQRKVKHVGVFTELENQMCAFTSDFDRSTAGYSPDRVDALVWGLSELMLGVQHVTSLHIPTLGPSIGPSMSEIRAANFDGAFGSGSSMPPGGWPAGTPNAGAYEP
jgi:phage terminase large subunit-like protein